MKSRSIRYLISLVWLVSLMNARAEGWETRTHPDWPGRAFATTVWSGSEVLLWGGEGQDGVLSEGWRYDPAKTGWLAMSPVNAPAPRGGHQAVWTGREMLVWGGYGQPGGTNASAGFAFGDGSRYDPQADRWRTITPADAPRPRMGHAAVWTGSEWVIWGGYAGTRWQGLRDDPATLGDGARYQPDRDRWVAIASAGAPASRQGHTAVWTGTEMLVWGGRDQDQAFASGARYEPVTDTWRPLNPAGAPRGRYRHHAVWTGSEMLVWGGLDEHGEPVADGGRYDPSSDAWCSLSLGPAVANLSLAPAAWTGREWILWGGYDPLAGDWVDTGARYDLTDNTWRLLPDTGAPAARWPTLAWTGKELLVIGGGDVFGYRTEVYAYLPPVITNSAYQNHAPVLSAIPDQTATQGAALVFLARASDPDRPAQVLSFSLGTGAPAGAGIDPVTGRFSWTPAKDQAPGTSRVTIQVSDGSLTDAKTFTMTVLQRVPLVITRQPVSQTVAMGTAATLSVEATGPQPITYQWWHDGQPIGGATGAVFTILNAQTNHAGQYGVAVASPAEWVASDNVTLTVLALQSVLTIVDATVREGNAGSMNMVFSLELDRASQQAVTVNYATLDNTAKAGVDYQASQGTVTFSAGQTTRTIRVPVLGDVLKEPDKTFYVVLSQEQNVRLERRRALGTIQDDDLALGAIHGLVTDALTKQSLPGVTLQAGGQTIVTANDGRFNFTNVPAGGLRADFAANVASGPAPLAVQFTAATTDGAYTLSAQKTGYSPYSFRPLELAAGESKEWNFSLSPSLQGLRFVLNWGRLPLDLDAHLLTPKINGLNYHIQYTSRYFGQTNRAPFAQLDTDATEGYGPETITIASNVAGIYHYYVHNYQEDQGNTGELTDAAAVVQIYTAAGLIQTVRVPTTGAGTYWDVGTVDGMSGQITVLNQLVDRAPVLETGGSQPPAGGETSLTRCHWLFGDGTGSDLENPAKTYLTPGDYTVNLELTLPDGRKVSVNKPQLIRVLAPTPAGPRLALTRIGGEATIMWESAAGGYLLERCADLRGGAWVTVSPNPTQNGSAYTVRVSLGGQSFYRLRRP